MSTNKKKKRSTADEFLRKIIMVLALLAYLVALLLLVLPFLNPLIVEFKKGEVTYQIESELSETHSLSEDIRQPSFKDIINYHGDVNPRAIGQLVYENKAIDLPIYQELSEDNLMTGVVAMNPERDPLTENYTIIGHNFGYGHTLLSDLVHIKKGETVFLNVLNEAYQYQVTDVKIVPETEVSVLDNTDSDTGQVTIITCDVGEITDKRLVVHGKLIEHDETGQLTNDKHQKVQQMKQQQVTNYSLKVSLLLLLAIILGCGLIIWLFR